MNILQNGYSDIKESILRKDNLNGDLKRLDDLYFVRDNKMEKIFERSGKWIVYFVFILLKHMVK